MNFDEIKNKATELLEQHHETVEKGIDQAADFISDRLGHQEQVHSVAKKAKDALPGAR
ncbi:antitoxin [Actinosynnema pretiosum]|uniref:Antitoxin n=1 Tax=Actinosynnema pretiosum TaxID=42197 RepID=A0A290YZ41_9PSEU|nr:antitoxin [Actinosynnema pretiosum]ATE52010.1 hypothetical protein CNX65_00830 [Actinosynnema pretiosum]